MYNLKQYYNFKRFFEARKVYGRASNYVQATSLVFVVVIITDLNIVYVNNMKISIATRIYSI